MNCTRLAVVAALFLCLPALYGQQDIDIQRPAGNSIPTSGTSDIGAVSTGGGFFSFRCANTGSATLTMNPISTPVSLNGFTNCSGSCTIQPNGMISAGGYSSFQIQVIPGSTATFSLTMTIGSDDPNENPYIITVTGNNPPPAPPQIEIRRPAGTTHAYNGLDDLGSVPLSPTVTPFTYEAFNQGTQSLTFTGVTVDQAVNVAVSVTAQPVGPVTTGNSASFTASVSPQAAGGFSFRMQVVSNAVNWPTFILFVAGNHSASFGNLQVQRPVSTAVPAEGLDQLGNPAVGVNIDLTYTMANIGTGPLRLVNSPAFTVDVQFQYNCTATVLTQPTVEIIPGQNTQVSFQVRYNVASASNFSFVVFVYTDDPDTPEYIFSGIGHNGGSGGTHDIEVQRPTGTSIATGATDNIGTYAAAAFTNIQWNLINTGYTPIFFTPNGITVTLQANCTAQANVQLGGGLYNGVPRQGYFSFTALAAGAFSFRISIGTNDPDESPYIINVSGNATGGTPTPDIDLQRPNGVSRPHNGPDNIGSVTELTPTSFTWEIHNTGTGTLTLTGGTPASVSSPSNCTVNVTAQPSISTLGVGASTSFSVSVTASGAVAFSFVVNVANDDPNENPYVLNVSGTGISAGAARDIDLQRPNGTSKPSGGTDSLGTLAPLTPTNFAWEIHNVGGGTLALTGGTPVSVSNPVNCSVSVAAQPALLSIPGPGSYTTTLVSVQALTTGAFSFTLNVASDDPDENPYVVNVVGNQTGGGGGGDGGGDSGGCTTADSTHLGWLFGALAAFLMLRVARRGAKL